MHPASCFLERRSFLLRFFCSLQVKRIQSSCDLLAHLSRNLSGGCYPNFGIAPKPALRRLPLTGLT